MKILQNIKALARNYKNGCLFASSSQKEFTSETKEILLSILEEFAFLSDKQIDEVVDMYCNLITIDASYAQIADLLPVKITKKHRAIMAILEVNPFFISSVDKKDQTLGMANKVYKASGRTFMCFVRENLRVQVCPNSPTMDEWNKKIVVPEGFQIYDVLQGQG